MNLEKIAIMQVPPYIRVPEAYTYFGIKPREAWNLIAQKKIVASKIGKLWRLDTASIIKHLKKYQNVH